MRAPSIMGGAGWPVAMALGVAMSVAAGVARRLMARTSRASISEACLGAVLRVGVSGGIALWAELEPISMYASLTTGA